MVLETIEASESNHEISLQGEIIDFFFALHLLLQLYSQMCKTKDLVETYYEIT